MKTEIIVAKSKGEVVGEKEINIPESVKEAIGEYGEGKVLSYFVQHLKVAERATLYPKVASAGSVSRKKVYEDMVAAGVDEATASQISNYTPEG